MFIYLFIYLFVIYLTTILVAHITGFDITNKRTHSIRLSLSSEANEVKKVKAIPVTGCGCP
jgi:predicted Na+-dependent transporter